MAFYNSVLIILLHLLYMKSFDKIIERLQLKPHPEGGFFKETYRSVGEIEQNSLGSAFWGNRNYSTAIYFLLTSEMFSAFHRIRQDEVWHFYDGSPICLHVISPEGEYSETIIGKDIENGEHPQFVVPAGYWFASHVKNENDYSLVGCTVSPGFDFKDFELAVRNDLISSYPQHQHIITQLTRV